MVAAITSNLARADCVGNIWLNPRESSLERPSVVNLSQLYAVDKSKLTDHVGRLSTEILAKVDDGLRIILALQR